MADVTEIKKRRFRVFCELPSTHFEVDIEAEDAEEAQMLVEGMSMAELCERADPDSVDVEEVVEIDEAGNELSDEDDEDDEDDDDDA